MPARSKAKKKAQKIQVGNKVLRYGNNKQVSTMADSNDLYEKSDFKALRMRLEDDGYIFIRGVIPTDDAVKARLTMLAQCATDGATTVDDKNPIIKGRILKSGGHWPDGYCVDAITGSEVNEREGIDEEAWQHIGPSEAMRAVYNAPALRSFWQKLFGENTQPLIKQTFLRCVGEAGTQEHADYYYFKRDTQVFSDKDGQSAMAAAEEYLKANQRWNTELFEWKAESDEKELLDALPAQIEKIVTKQKQRMDKDRVMQCSICNGSFALADIGMTRMARLAEEDFGVEGQYHCPKCALSPFAIYTTWIALSDLKAPNESILAVAPKTHHLRLWDIPAQKRQVPSDFNWTYPWVVPDTIAPGDIILFNIKTVHGSSINKSSPRCYRVSCDTRLQLAPIDPKPPLSIQNTPAIERPLPHQSGRRRRSSYVQLQSHPQPMSDSESESQTERKEESDCECDSENDARNSNREPNATTNTGLRRSRRIQKRETDVTSDFANLKL